MGASVPQRLSASMPQCLRTFNLSQKLLLVSVPGPPGEILSDDLGQNYRPQHFLYFFPLPQGHGSFLPIFSPERLTGFFFCCPSSPCENVISCSSGWDISEASLASDSWIRNRIWRVSSLIRLIRS